MISWFINFQYLFIFLVFAQALSALHFKWNSFLQFIEVFDQWPFEIARKDFHTETNWVLKLTLPNPVLKKIKTTFVYLMERDRDYQ